VLVITETENNLQNSSTGIEEKAELSSQQRKEKNNVDDSEQVYTTTLQRIVEIAVKMLDDQCHVLFY
jgi:hypothetical protein